MTNRAIYDNLKRLLIFFDQYEESKIEIFNNDITVEPINLYHEYYRVLDFLGCSHSSGIAYLILNNDDFNEFIEDWCKPKPNWQYRQHTKREHPAMFTFFLDYYWKVINKDFNGKLIPFFTVKDSIIINGETIVYISEKDHFDDGKNSAAKGIKKVRVESTNEPFKVVGFNTEEINKHFIIIKDEVEIRNGENLIINDAAFFTDSWPITTKNIKYVKYES